MIIIPTTAKPSPDRFLYADTAQGAVGTNMFAYCNNNPVMFVDPSGTRDVASTSLQSETAYDRAVSCRWQNRIVLEKYNPEPIGRYSQGNVYLVDNANDLYATFPGDVVIIDRRNAPNSEVIIIDSFKIKNEKDQYQILKQLAEYEQKNPTNWNRDDDIDNMVLEWHDHNIAASITNFFPIGNIYDSAREVNLDNNDKDWRWYKWFFK